jgi:hypothetical protein
MRERVPRITQVFLTMPGCYGAAAPEAVQHIILMALHGLDGLVGGGETPQFPMA